MTSSITCWNCAFCTEPPDGGVEITDPAEVERWAADFDRLLAEAELALDSASRDGLVRRPGLPTLKVEDVEEWITQLKNERRIPGRERLFKVRVR